MLSPNSQLLVRTLEAIDALDGRFTRLQLINYDSLSGEKRGCFSLVFKAHDKVEDRPVAIKFYDIDPRWLVDDYRRNAFVREHDILQSLLNKERCLQLASALKTYHLQVEVSPGNQLTIPCQYFAVEWIDGDIDRFFLKQESYTAAEKLHLFNEIVLAVEALHRHEVFHRDLKRDNLRSYEESLKRVVVAIDLGTAARFDSGYLQRDYANPVGALAYAAPEAWCGLAGNRTLAPYNDRYALGCLLFELFNRDLFLRELFNKNPKYQAILAGMLTYMHDLNDDAKRLTAWNSALAKLGGGVFSVEIDSAGHSVPDAIVPLLNEIVQALTNVNFKKRGPSLEWVRCRVWSAIKVLRNAEAYRRKLDRAREIRRRREQKVINQAERHAAMDTKRIAHVSQ